MQSISPVTDADAWKAYPQHHNWYNKLWLSETLGYLCGPADICIPKPGNYIVRPVINLLGMGLGAGIQHLNAGPASIPAGYFWCELFTGDHYTVDYARTDTGWQQTRAMQGFRNSNSLTEFSRWVKNYHLEFELPALFDDLDGVENINVEFVGNKLIEVHLRPNPDPDCSELVPVWQHNPIRSPTDCHYWIPAPDSAGGQLNNPRTGFWARK